MNPVEMVELATIEGASLSSDGKTLAFVENRSDWQLNRTVDRLVLLDVESGAEIESFAPASAREDHDTAVWSPTGNSFLTTLKRAGDKHAQAYLFDPAGKRLTRLTEHKAGVRNLVWAPDGRSFYFESDNLEQANRDRSWSPQMYEEDRFEELYYYDLANAVYRPVIVGKTVISAYSVARDGRHLLVRMRGKTRKNDKEYDELWLIDAHNGTRTQLTRNFHQEGGGALSPDRRRFAYIAPVNAAGEPYYEPNVFVQTVGEDTPELLFPDIAIDVQDIGWDRDGSGLYVLGTVGLTTQLFRYDFTERTLNQITNGEHEIKDWHFDPATGRHTARVISARDPGDVWQIEETTGEMTNLSRRFEKLDARFALPQQTRFSWRAEDGTAVEGLLVLPVNYSPGTRYPLVTIAHGGPRSAVNFGGWATSRYLPVLAGEGYMVFLPNYRGGTGYGDAFLRDMQNNYFNNADDDVVTGIDALIDSGMVDPDRLVMMGWSAGGHMTNWLVGHTDRFKAAASGAGVSDWVSMYGESDFRRTRRFHFGGAPWEENAPAAVFRATSPLTYAYRIKTPMLLWSGKNDERVPATQNIMLYRALYDLGVESEFYLMDGEAHSFSKPRNQLFKINRELQWFARHLGRSEYRSVLPSIRNH